MGLGDMLTDPDIEEYVENRFKEFLDNLFDDDGALDKIEDFTVNHFPDLMTNSLESDGDMDRLAFAQGLVEWVVAQVLLNQFRKYEGDVRYPQCPVCGENLGKGDKLGDWVHPVTGPPCPFTGWKVSGGGEVIAPSDDENGDV